MSTEQDKYYAVLFSVKPNVGDINPPHEASRVECFFVNDEAKGDVPLIPGTTVCALALMDGTGKVLAVKDL